jgi:hypothetical protein
MRFLDDYMTNEEQRRILVTLAGNLLTFAVIATIYFISRKSPVINIPKT